MSNIPDQVQELVDRFARNLADYKSGKYNEEIDSLVYELYDLTAEEIKIVEGESGT